LAKEIAEEEVKFHPDWFSQSKKLLMTCIKHCNHTLKQFLILSSETHLLKLKVHMHTCRKKKKR